MTRTTNLLTRCLAQCQRGTGSAGPQLAPPQGGGAAGATGGSS